MLVAGAGSLERDSHVDVSIYLATVAKPRTHPTPLTTTGR